MRGSAEAWLKLTARYISTGTAAAIILTSCNPLKKMVERANEINVQFDPNPLVVVDDSIQYTFTIKFPSNYFHKKVKGTVTPVVKDARTGQEITTLKSITVLGEAVEGEGVKIPYEKGGSASVSDKLPYDPKFDFIIIEAKVTGQFKSKTADIPVNKVLAKGTITTHKLAQPDEKPVFVTGTLPKEVPETYSYDIHFDKAKYNLRPQELKQEDVLKIPDFIASLINDNKTLNSIKIDGYASPEGEIAFNNNLSVDRTKTAQKHLIDLLNSLKNPKKKKNEQNQFEKLDIDAFTKAIQVEGHGEDWQKFKADLEASDVKDKDLVLRILQMYQDPVQREKEIRNLSKVFDELERKVLPKQRRAEVRINVSKKPRTVDEIKQLVRSNPDVLTVEEFLVAGASTNSPDEKLLIYQTAAQKFPNDWRVWNNLGYVYILKKNTTEAEKALQKAFSLNSSSPEVNNNLGIIERWKGNLKKAEEYYKTAGNLQEASYNLGVILLLRGHVAEALQKLAQAKTVNTAIAYILSGNASSAPQIIDENGAGDSPIGLYLKAIAGARTNNKDMLIKNLKSAISKDNNLRNRAKRDAEFIEYKDDNELKTLLE